MTKYEQYSFERKQLQSIGKAPKWLTTAGYQMLVERNYLLPGETPIDMYNRIATRADQLLNSEIPIPILYASWFDAFFDVMWKGWLSPSTPVLTNMGTDRGHPVSCSGTYIPDSIRGFYEARMEIAQLTQRGYGTSAGLDAIRHRGAPISKGGTANGIMQPAKGIVDDMKDISQGSSRRGSCGLYLDILHPDFDELADQILAEDQGWNVGWNLTKDYLSLFYKDRYEADRRWTKMLKTKLVKGKGYLHFLDKVNAVRPKMYEDRGYFVKHSNLCVAGSTKILTRDNGYVPIETLEGTTTTIWDGKEYVDIPIFKTSEGQSVLTVTLDNTTKIIATPYHRWYVKDGYKPKPIIKETKDLLPGDRLIKFDLEPIPHGTKELELAYVNGFHTGDGTMAKSNPRLDLHDNKQLLASRFTGYFSDTYTKEGRVLRLNYHKDVLKPKFFIPDNNYSVASRVKWLEGYFDADGTLTNNNGTESIQVACVELNFLQNLMLMLQELGIHSTISKVHDGEYRKMPANDGTEALKEFWCKPIYRLLVAGSELNSLLDLGYEAGRVQPTRRKYQREARQFTKVVNVVDEGEVIPTYCGTNPVNETLMLNGVQTLNCSEISLFNDEEHSFTCVLSSVNVAKYDEWKDTPLIHIATVFLDTVIDDMLEKAKSEIGFEKVIKFTENTRAIGLGVLGLSTYYQQKMWPFGSMESILFNQMFFKDMDNKTLETSKLLANYRGCPEYMKPYGERFSHRIALPPTMSTAEILGGPSQGVEPVFANVYEAQTAGGIVYRINPTLLKLMKERNVYSKETMKHIAENQGSIFAEDWLTDDEKEVFRTAFELNQETILLMASHRQKAIDTTRGGQGQSLNLYFKEETPEKEISHLHMKAFLDDHIKSLYYVRTLNEKSKLDVPVPTCSACEG